ncbi:MAG: hypothetical protein AAFN78_07510 [Pseudomonadota bacterium]
MDVNTTSWRTWHQFFSRRKGRQIPQSSRTSHYDAMPASLAKSLAIFQLGESGGGTVVAQARESRLPGVDAHYGAAMELFVAEEHRHATILANCVHLLGGSLIRSNWTDRLFVAGRRLMGLRLKVLVLLAAEVVGICYYHLLATRLPDSDIKRWLTELVADEQSHLLFHCTFLRSQTKARWQRWVFVGAWRGTMLAAAVVVMMDHRHALRDMKLDLKCVWTRWRCYSRRAERLVTAGRSAAGLGGPVPSERPL